MGTLAIIPARGGSKRFPRKSIVQFLGRPLICFTIDAALAASCVDRVLVSTDDGEIADVATSCGVDVHVRRPDLASDTARVIDVCLDVLENDKDATERTRVVLLYPTAPLRGPDDIDRTAELLEERVCEFSMAVTRYLHPPHQALVREDRGAKPFWPDLVHLPSQLVPDLVVDNGSTYAFIPDAFRREKSFYGSTLRVHEMPLERSIDINVPDDLRLLEVFASYSDHWRTASS